jgi:aspartyl-tRNA(Asn)/glutamyl-tRNA(Gln) amidotransferase subunit A
MIGIKMSVPIHFRTINSLQQSMQAGALKSNDIETHFNNRIKQYNPTLNAFLMAAEPMIGDTDSGPLFGMPIGIKNNIAINTLPLTAGIGARRHYIATSDAPVVTALKNAGARIAGTLNMHEAALGATTDNIAYGRCHNPHKIGFTPGGSSGGSASAVAAGLCVAALGTDTLGSIRIPASFCGIYGLKPTFGAISNEGCVPMGSRFDCVGPIARHVSDLHMLWSVMGTSGSGEIKRVAILKDIENHAMHYSVNEAYGLAKSLTEGLDYSLETHGLGDIDFARTLQASLVEIERECVAFHRADLERDPEGFSPELRAFLNFGATVTDADCAMAHKIIEGVRLRLLGILATCDAILLPTAPCAPFSFSQSMPNDIAHFTLLASIAGLPALSLPCGWSYEGLPIGVQIIGRAGSENALLDMATRLDAAAGGYVFPADFTN